MKPLTPKELVELLQRRREAFMARNGRSQQWYEQHGREIETEILRALSLGSAPTADERVRILADINSILGNGVQGMLTQAEKDMLRVLAESLASQQSYMRGVFGIDGSATFRSVPNQNIVRTFMAMEDRIRSRDRRLLGVVRPLASQKWALEWRAHWTPVVTEIQGRLVRAQLTGETVNEMARALTGSIGGLEINGHIPPEKFARSFVRTTTHQLYSEFSIALGTQAGVSKFANVGVSDERQSLECREADAQPAKTLAEWDQWKASNGKGGRPGERHVLHCRCVPAAIPDEIEDEWNAGAPALVGAE